MLIIQEYTTTTETTTTTKAIKTNEKANLRVGSGLYVDPTTYRVRVGSSHVDDSDKLFKLGTGISTWCRRKKGLDQSVKPAGQVKGAKRSLSKPRHVLEKLLRRTRVAAMVLSRWREEEEEEASLSERVWYCIGRTQHVATSSHSTSLLYVSRLHHSTKVEEVIEYMRVKFNWTLRVELLKPRHKTNFKSFVVLVPTNHLEKFLKDEFPPKDKRDEDEEVCTYGNPLLYGKSLVGILIYAKGCANQVTPAVYTRISEYTNWIDVTMTMDSHRGDQLIGATSSINIVGVTLLIPLLFLLLSV
ncbi:unnamed protein product [Spodoptera exigua]|nr:unnamed protein product [Spodoptera exigua]